MDDDDNDAAWAFAEEQERRQREDAEWQKHIRDVNRFRMEQAAEARKAGNEHEAKWWERRAAS